MALTKADLRDATLLIKAGRVDAARRLLSHCNDPRAVSLLLKLDARFPLQPRTESRPRDEFAEIKRLIVQKKFDEAETLLRASSHPKARVLLDKLTLKRSTMEAPAPVPPQRSVLRSLSGLLASVTRKGRALVMSRSSSNPA